MVSVTIIPLMADSVRAQDFQSLTIFSTIIFVLISISDSMVRLTTQGLRRKDEMILSTSSIDTLLFFLALSICARISSRESVSFLMIVDLNDMGRLNLLILSPDCMVICLLSFIMM
ncbi:hypothetical protein pCPXV0200 [Cowpox virus]|uniref:Uncharacterized protein n=1 Tax=Cowpox virus TaxID=10243 RepID=A0A0K2YVP3_COWPX|nr:hypothetical protein pCPXV0200 [Cowpox virus]SNB48848.1 hypothetical protein pCPXV0200 [Cowpox virus]SNB49236.1 hypothetical protein pCPXV0200 [Cowpox virus]SNB50013.1 hypothetical protein pCPXV0200 [Cowpox virus]SNB52820.1 hypothetical protein pCPXV0200 [Cowpox virus]